MNRCSRPDSYNALEVHQRRREHIHTKGKLQITTTTTIIIIITRATHSINLSRAEERRGVPEADPVLLVHVCLLQRHHLTDTVRRKAAKPARLLWNQRLAIIIGNGGGGVTHSSSSSPHHIITQREKKKLRCNEVEEDEDDDG